MDSIKKGFVYSCLVIVVVSLIMSTSIMFGGPLHPAVNFDPQTLKHFHELNPKASGVWEYFSYIQLGEWIDIHPAYFSMYLIFCVCIVLQEILEKKQLTMVNAALMAAFVFFIVQLSSRMAIVTLPIVVLYLVHTHFKKQYTRKVFIGYSIFLGLFLLLIWINPVARFRILQEPLSTTYQINQDTLDWNSISFRLLEWTAGAEVLRQSLITGVGTGDAQHELQQYYDQFNSSTANITYNAHNQYLQTALELGLPGICLLVACLVSSLFTAIRQNPLQIAFVVIIGCMCLTESIFARQKGIVFFTLFQSMFLRSSVIP
jgi:O-antigen ligase